MHNNVIDLDLHFRFCQITLLACLAFGVYDLFHNNSTESRTDGAHLPVLKQLKGNTEQVSTPLVRRFHGGSSNVSMSVAFLKVHKAASTTTQAIFLRYGWTRNLTFILPPEYNRFGYPNIISTNESLTVYNTLRPPPGKTFDILCHHVVYNAHAWTEFLPKETLVVGTVRQPFSLFKSMLNYFDPGTIKKIQGDNKLREFLTNPQKYEQVNVRSSFTNNRMAFEFGVEPQIIKNRDIEAFKKYLTDVLDKNFDIVIVAERFEESLVLMRRLFKWTLRDILYATKNVRPPKAPQRYSMGEGDEFENLYKKHAVLDYILYDHFLHKLNKQIAQEGVSFADELRHFKEVREYVEKFCHFIPKSIKAVEIDSSKWNEGFTITRDDCAILHLGEIHFTQNIRRRQYGNATWTFGSRRV